jgi:hypothetical protein
MRSGYVALFSLVIAYSAYQGTGSLKPAFSQQESGTSRDSSKATESVRVDSLSAGVEPLPTISGGVCRLSVNGDRIAPCGNCRAICPARELSELIEGYFRAESGNDRQYLAAHWQVPHTKQRNIRFVIASVPDPVHTHMALLFDREIEAIQRAAQASGYLFSRAWMPWDISKHIESPDFTVRMAQVKFREQVESLPGLMIFHTSPDEPATKATDLFVFVVGETPTGGLRIEQFQNALNIRQSMLADADLPLPETTVLRIYGPGFSGSLSSLDAILNAQPHDRFSRILVRSGSISSYRAVHDFCESTKREWPDVIAENDSKRKLNIGRPDFATFQFSDAYQEFYLSVFFRDRHELHSHIAVLSEDETAFGNQEARAQNSIGAEQQSAGAQDPCQTEPPTPVVPLLRLYFPREIAQLRDAYQQNAKIQSAATSERSSPQNGLALSLSVTGNDDDSVAAYSPLQTPLSEESILQGIVATLRKQHAKVVIIRAADPLDMIFLSRYLRQNYPQARLVTVGADLLMVHDFYDPQFHGILAITTYPILTGSRFATLSSSSAVDEQKEILRLFPDSYSVGDFNALRSLLVPVEETDSESLPATDYSQFGLPSFLRADDGPWRAHLWLTTVGRDGYWPVSVLDDVSPNELQPTHKEAKRPESSIRVVYALPKPPPVYSVHFTVGWTILWMLTFGLTVFVAFMLAFPGAFSRSEILGRFGDTNSRARDRLLFTGSVLLLIAQTLFLFPAVIWLGHFGRLDHEVSGWQSVGEVFNGMWLVMACYLISALWLGAACYKSFKTRGNPLLARTGIVLCVTGCVVTLSLTLSMWTGKVDSSLGNFVYRYINVGSGVSPLLPLLFLLAAWIWWCWQSLTGIASTEEKEMVLPDTGAFDPKISPATKGLSEELLPDASERVRLKGLAAKEKQWPWRTLGAVPSDWKISISAFVGLLLIILLMRPSEIAEAFESTAYKWIYWILLYSCLLLVCHLVTHIVALWLQFRTLLRAIENVPFRRGFSDLKSLTWKPLWKLAGNGREEFVQLLGRELDALRKIKNSGISVGGLATAIDEAKKATEKVSSEYEKVIDGKATCLTVKEVPELFRDLQTKLAKCVSEALIYANQKWRLEPYSPPGVKSDLAKDSEHKEALVDPPAEDPATRAVEHFLCLFYLNIILVPLRRLQTLILAMAGVFVFVLISYSSYPFESRESFHVLLISIFFVISLVVGVVYGQMYANPLLSRITNTKPGELGLDFWVRLGTFVFVPLLSLLSVQFPEVNNFLFSWLEPALQSIK